MAITDNTSQLFAQLTGHFESIGKAVGMVCKQLVQDQIISGYEKPIWQTGDLLRTIYAETDTEYGKVDVRVGSPMEYAIFVHDGTRKMQARPFIRDALINDQAKRIIKDVVVEQLQKALK